MRDKRYIAEHRGGTLNKEQHRLLVIWACDCVENILPLYGNVIDERLTKAIKTARKWVKGTASVGDARNASINAIALANELENKTAIAIARSVGHAVAAAHMADHSLRAAEYALKAVKLAGKSMETERKWQDEHLSTEIIDMVLASRNEKKKHPTVEKPA